ncbi:response regulator [Phototrophicus methaneseepsis]|uniref:Response regulator n=1 Tax=Phototrophicus methaneseepsis TaxID=2710758 RepID=A0A7S8E8K8_9CHLR|nr:response regulator [Phototrophicus methaneseepsis]QPC82337.1 response regulator [Phototrophicus methaneseepsis]
MVHVAQSQPVILIVEDTLDFAQMTMHILSRIGVEAVHALTADEAIDFINEQRPDLILLDLNLPGKSGWDVLKHLKSVYGDDNTIPIIITSAYSDSANRLVGKLQNVHKYMIKPFPPQDLMATVREVLDLKD